MGIPENVAGLQRSLDEDGKSRLVSGMTSGRGNTDQFMPALSVSEIRVSHIGYVVRDIMDYSAGMPGLGHVRTVDDPVQNARLGLYQVGASLIELIQPLGPKAFVWGHLSRAGEGLHHICYENLSNAEVEQLILRHKMVKVRGPLHAVLFDRQVVFAVTRNRSVVEFLL